MLGGGGGAGGSGLGGVDEGCGGWLCVAIEGDCLSLCVVLRPEGKYSMSPELESRVMAGLFKCKTLQRYRGEVNLRLRRRWRVGWAAVAGVRCWWWTVWR